MERNCKKEKFDLDDSRYQAPIGSTACKSCVLNNYQEFCGIHEIDDNEKAEAQFFALGLASESGEVAGDIMKHYVYAPERTSRDNIIREIGDSLWYAANLLTHFDSSFSEAMMMNIDKLVTRYPERFSDTSNTKVASNNKTPMEKEIERLLTLRACVAENSAEKTKIDNQIEGLLIIENS